ncbi:AAA family ATPase, partial [bacterium]|nr:AAA family ATPase [bacterium]
MERRITPLIESDLSEKMVLLSGPRQCGKTTLAQGILKRKKGAYYNWDAAAHRMLIRKGLLEESASLWVFDELHKFRSWRNWLKGVYDLHKGNHSILVTGSARLDLYRRGGDSLQGRYFFHHLHPFTLSEVVGVRFDESTELPHMQHAPNSAVQKTLEDLIKLGGFPEPFLSGSQRKADRWRLAYSTLLVREDIRDLERVQELDKIELLYDRLPECVGSVLSINSLREDLEVGFATAKNWIEILDRICATFRIPPFGTPRLKAVKKEQKLYLWDWARIEKPAARLENLIALHMLRLVHWMQDVEGTKAELRYFRDVVGHEVDFILLKKSQPWMAV